MEAFVNAVANMAIDTGKNLLNLEENVEKVETKLKRLTCRATDLQKLTNADQAGKKKRKREVENWFKEVKNVKNNFNEMKNRMQDDRFSRNLSTGDSVAKIGGRVEELIKQSQHFDGLMLDDHDENRGELRLTTKLFGDKFQEGMKRIWNWLVTDNFCNIGIYGQGGVGKTTLAKHIHNHLLEKMDFNVYWITVSQEFSIKKLQDDIAKLIKLDLSNEDDEDRRAARLSRSLDQQSVFILDDVWEEFCPEKIGIVLGADKCRLILTTRSLQLCHRMHCQREFNVITLCTNEAWDLFKYTLGLGTVLAAEVEEVAKLVSRRCSGLPLGVITVAGSMRGVTHIREWRNTLEQLRTSSIGYKEMEDKVFPILEWSFSRLNGCERLCFLYCCLYPEDEEIEKEQLINTFILAELIPRRNNSELEVDHGHTILNKIIKACLLEETENYKGDVSVKMHDLIRDMALRITSGKSISKINGDVPRFLVKSTEGRSILDQNDWTEDLNAVSFTRVYPYYSSIEVPPDMSPKCPNLSTLLFRYAKIERIPDSFFRHMDGLKILNLRKCWNLKELPNCISDMVNLTALLLQYCKQLHSVPQLGKLKKLRELDLSYTGIDDLPQGLEDLVKLERLYMQGTRMKNKIIPKGTFSKLHHLQHLVFPFSVHVSQPGVLKKLQVFGGKLDFMDVYNQFITSQCWPQRYNILVVETSSSNLVEALEFQEDVSKFEGLDREKNVLWFEGCNFQKGLDVILLPEDIRYLVLNDCSGLSDVFFQRLRNRSKDLCYLEIIGSKEVEFLLNFSAPPPFLPSDYELAASNFVGLLRNLQCLYLVDLPNLLGLINGGLSSTSSSSEEASFTRHHQHFIPPGTFSSLTELTIYRCHRLKKLFTMKLLQQCLQNLQKIEVEDCEQLEEIAANDNDVVVRDENRGETITTVITEVRLPKLEYLYLQRLPRLENICKATMICDSMHVIFIRRCLKIKRLPFFISINTIKGQPFPPKILSWIEGSKEWCESLEWDNSNTKNAFQPFFIKDSFW